MTPPQEPAAFLAELTLRNRGLIGADDQARLAGATLLVAGCGSTGGATVEPLVRAGATKLLLAEPGDYELNNLNRQRGSLQALGRNKAAWLADSARAINPHARIEVFPQGITPDNVRELCASGADLILDAVDVTSMAGLAAKSDLHEAAAGCRRPTVSAYDLAYRQYVRVYDYRKGLAPFQGEGAKVRESKTPMEALLLLVPAGAIPVDLLEEVDRLLADPGASISQLGCTADLFGALAVPLVIELLAGRPVKGAFVLDLRDAMMPLGRRLGRRWSLWLGLARAWWRMRRRREP